MRRCSTRSSPSTPRSCCRSSTRRRWARAASASPRSGASRAVSFSAIPNKDRIEQILASPRYDAVRCIVVSDGERILGPRRSRRGRHGHSHRQNGALHGAGRHPARALPAGAARRGHRQRNAAQRSHLHRLAAPAHPRTGVRRFCRGLCERRRAPLAAHSFAVGGFRRRQRGAAAGALSRPPVHIQRRHSGDRGGDHRDAACGGQCHRNPAARADHCHVRLGIGGRWHSSIF